MITSVKYWGMALILFLGCSAHAAKKQEPQKTLIESIDENAAPIDPNTEHVKLVQQTKDFVKYSQDIEDSFDKGEIGLNDYYRAKQLAADTFSCLMHASITLIVYETLKPDDIKKRVVQLQYQSMSDTITGSLKRMSGFISGVENDETKLNNPGSDIGNDRMRWPAPQVANQSGW